MTFNEKTRYRMLVDRRPLLTTFADKLAVRAYVESRVGASVLTDIYAVTSEPETLVRAELPREFVVKPTHGSGGCVVVADFAPPEMGLPESTAGWVRAMVRPDGLKWERLIGLCRDWLSLRYGGWEEWAYRNVPPRILVEELLVYDGGVPFDYKFFVFHGHARMIQVDLSRFGEHARNLYTPDWERLDVEYGKYPGGVDVERPGSLPEMLEIAARLGAEMDFVRVDLCGLGARVVFGELTNYPMKGSARFSPPEFDRQLGEWWTLPGRYTRE